MARRVRIVAPRQKVTPQLVARLRTCKFQPKLKAGMTNSEANDAIDAAFDRWIRCLRSL